MGRWLPGVYCCFRDRLFFTRSRELLAGFRNLHDMKLFDVIIIGGGPAALNAAVVLGRCRRKVLLFDTGRQRNRHSHGIHNFLTRDNVLPADIIRIARKEGRKYGVLFINTEITNAKKINENVFQVRDRHNITYNTKKILVATGLADNIPPLEGFSQFYGRSVFHCPYCDAWEVKDKKIVFLAGT